MNNFNFFNKKEEKNNINTISDNNRYKKLSSHEEKNATLGSTIISKYKKKYNIETIKKKYGILTYNLSPQITHSKIQFLKNKYINNNINFYKNHNSNISHYMINNVENMSINNNINPDNVMNKTHKKYNLFRNSSLQFVKENNIILNNFYNTLKSKKRNDLNNKNNTNIILNNKKFNNNNNTLKKGSKNISINYNNHNVVYKPKLGQNFKYLKNTREEFIFMDKKLNNLLKSEIFNKCKNKNFNKVFPISKKINMLNEVKNDIKNLNKKNFEDTLLTQKAGESFSNNQNPGLYRSNSERTFNIFYELFDDDKENSNIINNENEINKPILIKSLPKPKLNVPNYVNFYSL